MDEIKTQDVYEKQQKIAFASFLAELPNFIAMLVSAIFSNTLMVWMDLIDSFSNVMRSSVVVLCSRKLNKVGETEVKRIEQKATLICDCSVMLGVICVFVTSFFEISNPHQPAAFLWVTLVIKTINLTIDIIMAINQYRLKKTNPTPLVIAEFNGFVKDTSFDAVALFTLLICCIFREQRWSWYLSPIMCIVLGIYFLIKYSSSIKEHIIALKS